MAKKAAEKKPAAKRSRRPRTQALPGLEDRTIAPLEALATDVAEIREERAELAQRELAIRQKALVVMKQLGKTVYRHNGIEIEIVHGEDAVKMRVKPRAPGAADDDAEA
jgi:hypothetical protein